MQSPLPRGANPAARHGLSLVCAAPLRYTSTWERGAGKSDFHVFRELSPMTHASCDGLLVLDKPGGLTSRAALDRAARWFPRRTRIGHAGTLDPLAPGVLPLCARAATRLT